jgi:serine/threonine-protein kinase
MVPTFSRGVLADGRLFFTMEYVEGSSLHDIVLRRGPLPVSLALGILAEVADALHHAHEAGIVHRDLKPHNLMLCSHPHGARVRVLDFGMSKILGESGPGAVLTRDGAVFGTPAYMSPEQSRGRRPDRRSDIYALGCVGYELLLGRPPFRGSVAELFAAHVMTPPRAPSVVDGDGAIAPDVDAVILRCLEKRVEDRFQSGADLCAAIQALDDYRPLRVARAP